MEDEYRIGVEDADYLFDRLEKPKQLVLEPRETFIHMGTISAQKSSIYMEYGKTKLIVSIDPPRDIAKSTRKNSDFGVITCTVRYAPYLAATIGATAAKRESFLGTCLKQALVPVICSKDFCNFHLDIRVVILDDDGCVLSTAINGCSVALVEAGIPIFHVFSASTLCIYRDVVFVNPTAEEERLFEEIGADATQEDYGIVTTVSLPTLDQVAFSVQSGFMQPHTSAKLTEYTMQLNKRIADKTIPF